MVTWKPPCLSGPVPRRGVEGARRDPLASSAGFDNPPSSIFSVQGILGHLLFSECPLCCALEARASSLARCPGVCGRRSTLVARVRQSVRSSRAPCCASLTTFTLHQRALYDVPSTPSDALLPAQCCQPIVAATGVSRSHRTFRRSFAPTGIASLVTSLAHQSSHLRRRLTSVIGRPPPPPQADHLHEIFRSVLAVVASTRRPRRELHSNRASQRQRLQPLPGIPRPAYLCVACRGFLKASLVATTRQAPSC
ncbi:hypothetical protein EJ02DRAFT_68171 [Clathrospora elynae]|uniref:Uncharacterized protein n=1 Tax=Clathrospora elynae TaxID=706981 RepID=A0A6A5SI50_9PLEO|nr:hypothetical protein EJ02DRAFT_68171 [Clathrospora elynae]